MMKFAGSLARQRLYRDEDSYQFMRKLGVDGKSDGVVPDLAFLLPAPADIARPVGGPLVVGVGMMTYHGWHSSAGVYDAYIALHERLIEWLQARGYGVRMILGQTRRMWALHVMSMRD